MVSIETFENMSNAAKKFEKYKNIAKKGRKYWGRKKGFRTKRGNAGLANRYGNCEAQLIYRLQMAQEKLGRRPQYREIPFRHSLTRVFGSFKDALKVAGIK